MRILYFTRSYTPHDFRFLASLGSSGNQVFSLHLETNSGKFTNGLEDRALPSGVELIPWKGAEGSFRWRDTLQLTSALRKIIRRVKPDVVHAGPLQNAAFLAACSDFHPLVSMSWGSDILVDAKSSRWMRWVTQYTLNHSDILVGDCQAVKNTAVQDFHFPPERVTLFPWGVDLEQFSPIVPPVPPQSAPNSREEDIRKRLGWEDAFVLLSMRSWEPIYGVDVILGAFALAASQIPDLRLLLLGNGSQAQIIRAMITNYSLADRVSIEGRVTNAHLPGYYKASDLYLSASHSDGSSVSLMEALACGLPVLVSDIPGNCEWVQPGIQGWLFPDGDKNALADKIIAAYHSRNSLPEMRRAARALAEERADWKQNFPKLLGAYDSALRLKR